MESSRRSEPSDGYAEGKPPAAVLVFVRAPRPGTVKTRLAAAIGPGAGLRVYRRLAEHALGEALALADEGVEVRVHFTPADAEDEVRAWLGPGPRYLPQAGGDLGARMRDAFARAFADGRGRVAIIGSDLPGLDAGLLRRALALLDAYAAVLGPARDGGYYLLALRALPEGIFDGIAWSTPGVLAATLDRLRAAGITPAMLEELADVDEVEDLPQGWMDAEGASEV